jgi:hypothetical protein
VATALSVASAAWLKGAAAPVLGTRASASALPSIANRFNLITSIPPYYWFNFIGSRKVKARTGPPLHFLPTSHAKDAYCSNGGDQQN